MEKVNTCTICGHHNTLNVKSCVKCGNLLIDPTTLRVSRNYVQSIMHGNMSGDSVTKGLAPPLNSLALLIPGRKSPILVQIQSTSITIGRHSTTPDQPDIDLLTLQAGNHGVSRIHARIHLNEEGWFLEDLHSTNGTWLNDEQLEPETLYPLESGDHLRFGQFACSIRFSGYNEEGFDTTGAKEHGLSSF